MFYMSNRIKIAIAIILFLLGANCGLWLYLKDNVPVANQKSRDCPQIVFPERLKRLLKKDCFTRRQGLVGGHCADPLSITFKTGTSEPDRLALIGNFTEYGVQQWLQPGRDNELARRRYLVNVDCKTIEEVTGVIESLENSPLVEGYCFSEVINEVL